MKLYIAGPMTGRPDFNYPAFFNAERRLQAAGFETINPARPLDGVEHQGASWETYMRRGIRDVLDAEGVALLPEWTSSRGATLEQHVASSLAMPTLPLDQWLAHAEREAANR